jgi:endonuclease/exonuclease/phosphatase family metal-dependent hydrolase
MRIMTYNVHGCLGVDGVLSPARIAAVIAECEADVVALQELDVGRRRSGGVDQAVAIAHELEMRQVYFHPAVTVLDEHYGDAIITARPSRLVKASALPGTRSYGIAEPRGALWVAIDIDGVEVQVFNTHFGLGRRERRIQARTLLGPDWIGGRGCQPPVIFLGDLNSLPRGRVYRSIASHFRDAHAADRRTRARATYPSIRPMLRIDHVFVSPDIDVVGAMVWRSPTARLASDHLPLVVDLRLPERPAAGAAGRSRADRSAAASLAHADAQ